MVRVRQRASQNSLHIGHLVCPYSKRLSRAGTRGHDLLFPHGSLKFADLGFVEPF